MSWQIATLLTILSWGIAQILIKKGFSYLTPWQTFALDTMVALFIWIPFGLSGGVPINFGLIPVALSLFFGFAVGLYYYVMEKGPLTVLLPVFSANPAVTVLFSARFLNETLTNFQLGAILLTIIGVMLVTTFYVRGPLVLSSRTRRWVYLALILTVAWGIEGAGAKYIVGSFGNATYLVLLGFGQLTAVIVWYLFSRSRHILARIPKRYTLLTISGVILYNTGTITYAAALEHGLASIVQSLTELSILLIMLLSVIFLKERMTKFQLIGSAIALSGAFLLGYSTG